MSAEFQQLQPLEAISRSFASRQEQARVHYWILRQTDLSSKPRCTVGTMQWNGDLLASALRRQRYRRERAVLFDGEGYLAATEHEIFTVQSSSNLSNSEGVSFHVPR